MKILTIVTSLTVGLLCGLCLPEWPKSGPDDLSGRTSCVIYAGPAGNWAEITGPGRFDIVECIGTPVYWGIDDYVGRMPLPQYNR